MVEIITIVVIICGIIFIIISNFMNGNDNSTIYLNAELEEKINEKINASIEELNKKIIENYEFSQFIKDELESKHKELLFLYELINEKNKEIKHTKNYTNVQSEHQIKEDIKISDENSVSNHNKSVNSKNSEHMNDKTSTIIELAQEGYSVKEIAKMLDIGQGEVNLILNIYQ